VSAPRVLVSGVVLAQPMGGVRRHNAELLPRAARLLAEDGGSLAVLHGPDGIPFELPESVELLPSRVPARPVIARATAEKFALSRALVTAADEGRPFDVVHTAHLPVPRGLAAPLALTIHDLRSLELAETPMARRLVARSVIGGAVKRASALITVSETVRAELAARAGRPPESIHLVPNAADHLEVLPRAPGPDAPLLHVGHLEKRKNLELLLEALALAPELPRLELAGSEKNDERARLQERAAELGVSDRVRFLGAVPDADLPGLYARAACVVLPSRLEGFGIPALEAMRARCPLAVSSAGALPEVAPDAPRFAPDDAAGCAEAIRAALDEDERALDAAEQRAAALTWDASASALVEAWRLASAAQRS
jgi:glycosyltransferase involved in cell wall biosynthesis